MKTPANKENSFKNNRGEQEKTQLEIVAEAIRERSKASQLISVTEILDLLNLPTAELRGIIGMRPHDYTPSPCPLPQGARECGYPVAKLRGNIRLNDKDPDLFDENMTDKDISEILEQLIDEEDDIRKLGETDLKYYYSSRYMTGTYAEILFNKLKGPMHLIAETVRHNSCTYRQPLPLNIFTEQPFNLEYNQALDYLAKMAVTETYYDIATTSTSVSAIYLYSTSYIEKEHASMLAEWLEVGQFDNP